MPRTSSTAATTSVVCLGHHIPFMCHARHSLAQNYGIRAQVVHTNPCEPHLRESLNARSFDASVVGRQPGVEWLSLDTVTCNSSSGPCTYNPHLGFTLKVKSRAGSLLSYCNCFPADIAMMPDRSSASCYLAQEISIHSPVVVTASSRVRIQTLWFYPLWQPPVLLASW